ncbi:adenosylcobinamide amidohydrolase [Natrialba asiatica]|uniref:Adenosylcobinamide amidohydrolase n=1 Tax=Natrialba asiatica (strain ATCC 700177 / DSM 12278 / JCM 9576 / FERM P-10747 / NBRC 102637 / 172P1) TaxID=29540 RepID=M0AW86_NATA1|nr:adenosylcobinamide amidohydrolase [Natrialba asiatica]ELZ02805.1 adenosylcobinamide amidohydrolase [Natrialba asiatica DSM 12278]
MSGREFAYEAVRRDGVLRIRRPGTEWLSSGWNGGRWTSDCAYNLSVPDGWGQRDLGTYIVDRLDRAGVGVRERDCGGGRFGESEGKANSDSGDASRRLPGPALLTGVDIDDARGARCGSVTAYATAGISNPAALPMDPSGGSLSGRESATELGSTVTTEENPDAGASTDADSSEPGTGTVNVIVSTTRELAPGALTNLLAVATEAKTATLLAETGFPGTTTDAVVVGHDPTGRRAEFSGSATAVGAATRACVREAVRASLRAHYRDAEFTLPSSVEGAAYGVSTEVEATVFRPATGAGVGSDPERPVSPDDGT